MAVLLSALRVGVAVYVGMTLFVLLRQSKYVYYPDSVIDRTPTVLGLAFEPLRLPIGEDVVTGWFVPADTNAARELTVLFCHGNAGDIGDRVDSVATFHNMGLNVLIFDYRGYGDSTGKPTEKNTYADAMVCWRYLVERRGIPPDRIVVFGRSLGGGIASWLATEVQPAGLVLESTFTSAPDMARRMFPYLPVRWLCRFRYDTLGRLKNLRCPVLIAHGRADETVPYEHGRRLFVRAPEPKLFSEIIGGHNDGGLDADKAYQRIFGEFLDSLEAAAAER